MSEHDKNVRKTKTGDFSEDNTEQSLRVLKMNIYHIALQLAHDKTHLYEVAAEEEFVPISIQYARAFLWMHQFLFGRHYEFCERNLHQRQACQVFAVLYVNSATLFASHAVRCFVRRDALWVFETALLKLFLREIDNGSIMIEDDCPDREIFSNIIDALPADWIKRVKDTKKGTTVMKIGFIADGPNKNRMN